MVIAAKRLSQVATHMVIAYVLAYTVTGSAVFSGLAVLAEPVLNVLLLPFHEAGWTKLRQKMQAEWARYLSVCEKFSQAGLHAVIAFGVMYVATGSSAMGGLAALLEPVCNVLILPLHDRLWEDCEIGSVNWGRTATVACSSAR